MKSLYRAAAVALALLFSTFSFAQDTELTPEQAALANNVGTAISKAGSDEEAVKAIVVASIIGSPNELSVIVSSASDAAPQHSKLIAKTAEITRKRLREAAVTSCDRTQNATKGTPEDPCNIFSSASSNFLAPGNTFSFSNTPGTSNPGTPTNPGGNIGSGASAVTVPVPGGEVSGQLSIPLLIDATEALLGPGNPVSNLLITLASPN